MLQCVAVCCNVLQCVNDSRGLVVTFLLLQYVLLCALQCVAACCSVCCSVLQYVHRCYMPEQNSRPLGAFLNVLQCVLQLVLQCIAVRCSVRFIVCSRSPGAILIKIYWLLLQEADWYISFFHLFFSHSKETLIIGLFARNDL